MTREEKIAVRLCDDAELLQEMGYEVMAVFLQGSQNYGLDYEGSDIDTKAIVLPRFKDMVTGVAPVSMTHVLPSDEHIDIKDIRMMFDVWKRQNINFLEVLYTPYAWINTKYAQEIYALYENRDAIAHANPNTLMKCIYGVMDQKYHALTHPYPACAEEIEQFGYASKQLHHLLRGKQFMERIAAGENFGDALLANDVPYLVSVKATPGMYTLQEAQELADATMAWAKDFLKQYQQSHAEAPTVSHNELFEYVLTGALRTYWEGEWQAQREAEEIGIEFFDK
ncbi:MAG: nucleotidyltransferase domain-containing protein [Bacteroidaceae bacterium]|nr:nucleotidyltransferase domain-containing protein [Bacteroidaceae bacterium]